MDGASQVRHTAALAVRTASWLRDEEAELDDAVTSLPDWAMFGSRRRLRRRMTDKTGRSNGPISSCRGV